MHDLIRTKGKPEERMAVVSAIPELLTSTRKFEVLDTVIKKSRATLLRAAMKERRVKRLQQKFDSRAEKLSAQMEEHLVDLRAKLFPPPKGLPLETWARSDTSEQVAFTRIIANRGLCEESFVDFFSVIVEKSPVMTVDSYRTCSNDVFTERDETLDRFVIID
ncbi:unnamed protein product [Gongylonema pulchrum]|uniref:Uncharacterized protein n=1 Tax=Gongylonema pulchrum TaxID=637853 RepID=A0A183DVA8_9BILA|nr:unnamed protein product [Gongylonema pulchrum]